MIVTEPAAIGVFARFVSPMDDWLAILTRFEAQILLPASAARMHRLKLVVPRRQRLVHRRPCTDGTAINVKRGSLCGGGEGYEGNLRRPIALGLRRYRAPRVTAPLGCDRLSPRRCASRWPALTRARCPWRTAALDAGLALAPAPPPDIDSSRPSTTAKNQPRPALFTKLQDRSSTREHHGDCALTLPNLGAANLYPPAAIASARSPQPPQRLKRCWSSAYGIAPWAKPKVPCSAISRAASAIKVRTARVRVPPTLILATPRERRVAASSTGATNPDTTFTGAPIAAVSLPISSAAATPGTKMQARPRA